METLWFCHACDENVDLPMCEHALQTAVHVVSDGQRLDLVDGQAVGWLNLQLQHGGIAASGGNRLLPWIQVYEIDRGQEMGLVALH